LSSSDVPATGRGPSGPRAGLGRRLVAAIIDGVLLNIVSLVLQLVFGRALGTALAIGAGLAYACFLEGSPSGQTIGKRAMSIRVIDFASGGPLAGAQALVRYVGRIISFIPCALGYFWAIWDNEKQAWHDKIAGTVVVPVSAYPVAAWPGREHR